ncbi:MAG: serine hydrolase [Ferruginibacter sp.]|nr:serine hydrolase [Cytophagales bacterium]
MAPAQARFPTGETTFIPEEASRPAPIGSGHAGSDRFKRTAPVSDKVWATAGKPPSHRDLSALETAIRRELGTVAGDFAVAFRNLSQPEEAVFIRERESFHAASTMKTPVMMEVYQQAAAREVSLHDSVLVKNEFRSIVDGSPFHLNVSDDSEAQLYHLIGRKRTLGALVYDMITHSSNLATNLVIEKVDARRVTQTMRRLGAKDTRVLRGVEDNKAYEKGLNNTTTAYDLLLLYEKLARREVVHPRASDEMIQILLDQTDRSIIPARLPASVKVAHKTGNITGVHHDSGIVYLPDGKKYVLVLLSKNLRDFDQGTEALARVSELVYRFVAGE